MSDYAEYVKGLKQRGFGDKKKLQSMLKRAKELAAKQGKAGDKKVILGIFQSFFKSK